MTDDPRITKLSSERRELVSVLLGERGVGSGSSVVLSPRSSPSGVVALSFAQQRLWFLDQLSPGTAFYNVAAAVPLSYAVVPWALERAVNGVIARHEVLRTTFEDRNGRPVQVIAPSLEISLAVHDLRGVAERERVQRAAALASEEAAGPFDLQRGPLLRAGLIALGEAEFTFLLTLHHIVSDGWSMGILFAELSELYMAAVADRPPRLEPLPIQYADFAVWQRRWLAGAELERQLAYWREQLAELPVLALPTDRPRPAVQSFRGAVLPVALPAALTARLNLLAQEHDCTLFMLLLAAFQALLARYTGQDDIVVGTPVAGRTRVETEPLIGFFINTLVLRTDLSGDPSFRELLTRTREVALGAYAHQDAPFEMLVEELQPERDLSRNPLFQVSFQLLKPMGAYQSSESSDSIREVERGASMFDLGLLLIERAGVVRGRFEFNTDLFDSETVRRLSRHLRMLLEAAVADPDLRLSALPLLTEPERRRLTIDWQGATDVSPVDRCLHEYFEQQTVSTPDALAVTAGAQRLSYRELNERANRLAHRLRELGVEREQLVGICLERSPELVVAFIAVLKAGGAYLPLDPDYPPDRLAFMLQDAQAPVILTTGRLADRVTHTDARVVHLEREAAALAAQPTTNPANLNTPNDLAYAIYTSGSTGTPNGVLIEHRSAANHMAWMQAALPLDESDRVLQRTPVAFDASVWEVYAPLFAGACLVLAPTGEACDRVELVDVILEHRVTVLQLVPSHARLFIDEPGVDGCTSLRRVLCGGEPCPTVLYREFRDRLGVEVFNLYGPTETCIDATWWPAADGPRLAEAELAVAPRGFVPIGRPVANVRVFVVDRFGGLVPVGVAGELLIGGVGVGRGYLRREELTAQRFVPDTFPGAAPGRRLYRTGDVVRWLPDGELEFLGRVDDQVKLRGLRVEPGEVQAALSEQADVREAVVSVREDALGGQRLVAYVVLARSAESVIPALRAELARRLPEFMVPAAFVRLERLPRTPSGKVDLRALPAPEDIRPTLSSEFIAPRTPTEILLATLWGEVLGLRQVGINDNFFTELGGHSLLATQLASRIRKAFNTELPLRELFSHPTIAQLATTLEERTSAPQTHADDRGPAPRPSADDSGPAPRGPPIAPPELAGLSEAEVDVLLKQMLVGGDGGLQ